MEIFSHWACHFSIHWLTVARLTGIGLDQCSGIVVCSQISTRLFQDWRLPSPHWQCYECCRQTACSRALCWCWRELPDQSQAPFLGHSLHSLTAPVWDSSAGIQVPGWRWVHCWECITADLHPWRPPRFCFQSPPHETFWMQISFLESASC